MSIRRKWCFSTICFVQNFFFVQKLQQLKFYIDNTCNNLCAVILMIISVITIYGMTLRKKYS